ncbi:MAG: aminotransferase class V-fold PLP-dependent enzyme [Planctomycetes bacterium]|nr:aminotransferase class V-fold PLP-dependent enzyme [Planctomycetota bacterium]
MAPPTERWRDRFLLDADLAFLNHGSFGACPREVLERSIELRREVERDPVDFLAGRLEGLLDGVRHALGPFVGASPDDLALVPNATTAINAVARSLSLGPGDEVVAGDHEYGAAARTLDFVCRRAGARLVRARVPVPLRDREQVVESYRRALGPRTRLLLASHVTSPTALVLPIARLVELGRGHGVPVLVDGAHGPGQIPLDLDALGADWYAGNGHKWLLAPKGAGFLHVCRDRQAVLEPLVVSWGWPPEEAPGDPSRGRLARLFDWPGTTDPTALLSVPVALAFLEEAGLARIREHARALLESVSSLTGLAPVGPADGPEWQGCMVSLVLPLDAPEDLGARLRERHRVVVACPEFFRPRVIRVSAHLYNSEEDLLRLARALREELGPAGRA